MSDEARVAAVLDQARRESETAERFRVDAVPVTVLVDRRGRVVARDLRGVALEATVESLVGLGETGPPET